MSDSHLPDDLAQWPADPFAVLGVRPGVGPRELRKAYTALIRVFKPEHRPDHFRRIREAFEFVQRHAIYFQPDPDDEPGSSTGPIPTEAPASDEPLRWRTPLVSLEQIWDRAVRGETAVAYRALVAELDRGSLRAEVYARLYWLAVVAPEVDPARPPAEWLTRGMSMTGVSGVLFELYRSELVENPGEATSARAGRVLTGNHPPADLAAFARLRWQALGRAGRWDMIRDDYERVRQVVGLGDEAAWLSLLADLVTWVAWGRRNPDASALVRQARKDVKALEHLGLRQGGPFDQIDWLDAVARSCDRLRAEDGPAAQLAELLRDSWLLPPELLRRPLEELLAQISDQPARWVERFDRAGPKALAALNQFGNLLGRYQVDAEIESECPHRPELVRKLARMAVVDGRPAANEGRARALRLCLDEALDPDMIRSAFHPNLGGPDVLPRWVAELADDAPLYYVCWACRLYRA